MKIEVSLPNKIQRLRSSILRAKEINAHLQAEWVLFPGPYAHQTVPIRVDRFKKNCEITN